MSKINPYEELKRLGNIPIDIGVLKSLYADYQAPNMRIALLERKGILIRLKRGHSLLEQGKSNISEVAADVGFSAKQFSKYFKEEYGCLPSEFLRKN